MKFAIITDGYTTPQMQVSNDTDELLIFDLSSYNKNHLIGENDVCSHINQYWAQLPAHKQEKIFNCYVKIRKIFEEVFETSALCIAIMPIVKQLFAEHDLNAIEHWIAFHGNVTIPAKFDEVYIQSDEKPFSRDKTYTRPDYSKLVALTMTLRIMVPIWGEFILRTRAETGTSFKEYYAYTLVAQTKLNESPAVEKLRTYIEANIQSEKSINTIIVGGIGSEDYATWILSGLLVKRLSVGDIRGREINTNLVVTVHNDLLAKNNGNGGNSFGEPILNKIFESDTDSDHGVSRIENFKLKAEHSIGDICTIEYFMENYKGAATLLMPNHNPALLEDFIESSNVMLTERIWPAQIALAQWVLAPILSPRGIYHLDKITTVRALAIAQCYLWQNGHKKLAVLLTAIASDNRKSSQQTGIGSTARITRDQLEELTKLFPYNRISAKRKNTIPPNVAMVAIDLVADDFSARDWILSVPPKYAEEITGIQSHRRYSCPHDIKIILAAIAIEVAKRPAEIY